MKYFAVSFGNHMTFIMKTEKQLVTGDVVFMLSEATGLKGFGGSTYNPRNFISVESIGSPDERQKRVARDLEMVLF